MNFNCWRRGYRQPLVLIVLLLTLALALGPSAVPSTVALERTADIAHAGATAGGGALSVDAHEGDDDHHMWGGWWDGGWWIVMPILMVLFWATVIGLVVWGITQVTRGERSDGGRALDIAQERYARGEISREEFEQIRRDLR